MKKLLLILALLVASVGAHAQGTWSGLQTTTVSGMTHGYMNWHYLLLNYTGSGVRSPVLVYLHQNDAGNPCYPTSASGCSTLIQSASSGGTGVTNWFNNSTFQSQYCPSGCIVVSPYADQTSDTSGVTSNFGGYNDSPGSMANERGVIAVLQYVLANFNADPSRVYVTGDGMGGAGAMALGLDYGVGTGSLSPQIITATLPFSGAIYRNGATAPTSAQVSQIEGGGIQFSVSGGGDVTTGQAPSQWVEPLWDAIAGKPSGNNMVLSVPTPAAAVG